MKQIKTVVKLLEHSQEFDSTINKLLKDGWFITRREIITIPGEISESFNISVIRALYAELERNHTQYPEEITL